MLAITLWTAAFCLQGLQGRRRTSPEKEAKAAEADSERPGLKRVTSTSDEDEGGPADRAAGKRCCTHWSKSRMKGGLWQVFWQISLCTVLQMLLSLLVDNVAALQS